MTIDVITHRCFSCCRAVLILSQGLLCFLCCPASKKAGGAPRVGRAKSQDSWSKCNKVISRTIWCYVQHKTGRSWPGELPGDWLGIDRLVVRNCVRHHVLGVQFFFSFLIKLSLSQPMSFLTFALPVLFPTHPAAGEISSSAAHWVKPQQRETTKKEKWTSE